MFSKESLESLRQRVDLVDLVSSHVELKRTGVAHKGLCPFHDEKSPSFMIQKGDHHYHCFGCGAHGDAIQFLMTHLKLSFMEAVESLAEKYHVQLERIEGEHKKGPNKASLKQALELACRFYEYMLLHTNEGAQALNYLYQRGLDIDFIRRFNVGYAPATQGMLQKVLQARAINQVILTDAGLLHPSSREFFSDRITFPIRDASGAVIGFSARKFKEETFGGKYINTPETAVFKKSRVLFGLNYSRKTIAKERRALIVEGQVDALRLIQAGFDYTVAGQGTAFGEGHVKELVNLGISQAILALDGDNAGEQATVKIGNLFQKEGIEVLVAQLPKGSDPDAFLRRHNAAAFQQLIDGATDYLTFLVKHESSTTSMDSPAGKNSLLQKIAQQIRDWEHPVMVHESLRKLAQLTQTPESMLGIGQPFIANLYIKHTGSAGQQVIDPDMILESDLLRWLLFGAQNLPVLAQMAQVNIKPTDLKIPACRLLYTLFLNQLNSKTPQDLLAFLFEVEDEGAQKLLQELMQKKLNMEKADQYLAELLQKILERNWMAQREEVRMKIQSGLCTDEEALELAKQFDRLKRPPTVTTTKPE